VSALADRTDVAIGFRQLASVRRSAVGLTPWRDPSATPHIGQHESPGGRFGSGLGRVITAGLASDLRPGGYGPGGYGGGGYGGPFGAVRRHDAVDCPGSPLVRGLVATVPHTPNWAGEVSARLDG
jgi:hypothetical protein